jgi:hypothetical protein
MGAVFGAVAIVASVVLINMKKSQLASEPIAAAGH